MADSTLRRLERDALQGGPDAAARLLLWKVRTGHLPPDYITFASHLGDQSARLIHPSPRILIDCPNCRFRREERIRRNRNPNPEPTPLTETPKQCVHCNATERVVLERGLIKFAQEVTGVAHKLLIAWGVDCVEHQQETLSPKNPFHFQGRYIIPNQPVMDPELRDFILPACRRWIQTGEVSPLLYQRASMNSSPTSDLGVVSSLSTAVAASGIEEHDRQVRARIASVVSDAYYAARSTRVERTWQEQRLIQYLLGYAG